MQLFFTHYKFLFCLLPMLLSGCVLLAPEQRVAQETLPTAMPTQYPTWVKDVAKNTLGNNNVKAIQQAWWEDFGSQDLNMLVNKALTANFDILTAWASLRQSEAVAQKAQAGLFPTVDLDGSIADNRTSTQISENQPRTETTAKSYGLGVAASYEVDLWGRVNAQRQAESLRLEANTYDVQSAHMTVAASVADAWVSLLGNRAELAVVQKQIEINTDLVRLQRTRFDNGLSSSLSVLQQQELLASLKSEIPALEQQGVFLRNQLAVLQGTLPGSGLNIQEDAALPVLQATPSPGFPIQLLDARPDIQSAWSRLAAADWDVSEAHAQRYPSINLSASMVFNAAESSLLFSNWVAALAGSLFMPIFDGEERKAEEDRLRAVADERVQAYAKAVATAIQEVDNALAAEHGENATLQRLKEQLTFANSAMNEARTSYLGGATDYLNYIAELRNVQSLERAIAKQHTRVVQARITLNRALGGLTFQKAKAIHAL